MTRMTSVFHQCALLGVAAALLGGCGANTDSGSAEGVSEVHSALVVCTPYSTFHLLNGPVAASPAGEYASAEATSAQGFGPTHVINPSGFGWYTDAFTGSFNNGFYLLNLWTNQPGGSAPVFAQLGVANADGSGFSPIAVSSTVDVNGTGTGNHVTTLNIHALAPISLTNQRLVIKVFLQSGSGTTAPTLAYNGGDFDTNLQTPGGCATPTIASPTTFHLVNVPEPSQNPVGEHLRRSNTGQSGFTPTAPLSATPHYWYSELANYDTPSTSAGFTIWTNSPGASSTVGFKLEFLNADGSAPVALAQTSADVNASGTGNHATTVGPLQIPAVHASGRLRVTLTRTSGANATLVYNGGTDFDSRFFLNAPAQLTTKTETVLKDAQLVLSSKGGGGPNTNYGAAPDVVIGSTEITSRGLFGYSLFDIPTSASVVHATLVIPTVEGLPSGFFSGKLSKVNDSASWLENTVTWNNQPAATDLGVGFTLQMPSPMSAQLDVTAAVNQAVHANEGQISFLISSVNSNVFIWSKENGGHGTATSLVVQYQ